MVLILFELYNSITKFCIWIRQGYLPIQPADCITQTSTGPFSCPSSSLGPSWRCLIIMPVRVL